eukprot:m.106294 g.106294  ORF g.106294 m.106294 type:complete len:275 (-) comp15297_c0_seq1:1158-1982(-)
MGKGKARHASKSRDSKPHVKGTKNHRHGSSKAPYKHQRDRDWDEDDRKLKLQLESLGLRIYDIPGDGNCLFRSLMDQEERNIRGHLDARRRTVEYIQSHQREFECFIDEDEQSFKEYLGLMTQPGEFGDHLCLVAYARDSGHDLYVHQLDNPVWIIRAREGREAARQLHIVYYDWEHYDSLRLIADEDQDIYMSQSKLAVGRPKPKASDDTSAVAVDPAATLPRKPKGKGKGRQSRYEKQQQRQAKLKAKAAARNASAATADDEAAQQLQALAI